MSGQRPAVCRARKSVANFKLRKGQAIGCRGVNARALSRAHFEKRLSGLTGAGPVLTLPFGPDVPRAVGIVTGSGADALYQAEQNGIDTLITGEPRQFAYHFARERSLNVLFAGHYATETLGVRELGKALAGKFGMRELFLDHPTGI